MAVKKYGKNAKVCKLCKSPDRLIRRYNLYICGRCFREVAEELGFKNTHGGE